MANYKIIIPIENEEEGMQLKQIVESIEGVEFSMGKKKNIDGAFVGELLGDLEHVIQIAGSIASLYAVMLPKKVQIVGDDGVNKKNIKLEDIITFLKNLVK